MYEPVRPTEHRPSGEYAHAPAGEACKRAVDVVLTVLALAFLAPLMLLVALLVCLQDRGPILFAHERIGRHGSSFKCLKFRSMSVDAAGQLEAYLARNPFARAQWTRDHKLRKDPRITPLGRMLRRSSLDELPQLLNVLAGDMSLVGPRPIVEGEAAKYGIWFADYCRVRPGITGLWQISGRSDVDYPSRVALDVEYVRNVSLALDLRILALTVPAVLAGRGSC